MDEIIRMYEEDTGYKVLYGIIVGSHSIDNTVASSDTDYAFFINTPNHTNKRYDKTDIWGFSYEDAKASYPFYHLCNLTGFDNIVYACDQRITDFLSANKDALMNESIVVVYNKLLDKIAWLKTFERDELYYSEGYHTYNTSVMRDAALCSFTLNNIRLGNDLIDFTQAQKKILRDVRGKDGTRLSHPDAIAALDSVVNSEFKAYFNSLPTGRDTINQFNALVEEFVE